VRSKCSSQYNRLRGQQKQLHLKVEGADMRNEEATEHHVGYREAFESHYQTIRVGVAVVTLSMLRLTSRQPSIL
jgi:hypothetical protein